MDLRESILNILFRVYQCSPGLADKIKPVLYSHRAKLSSCD